MPLSSNTTTGTPKMKRVRQLAFLTSLVAGNSALALGSTDYENCLLTLIADSTNAELRVQDLKGLCENTAETLAVNEQSQREASRRGWLAQNHWRYRSGHFSDTSNPTRKITSALAA